MHILCYAILLCILHAPLHAFVVEHDVFKCVVEGDEALDVGIGVLADIHGERPASLEDGLDSVVQRPLPGVDIAFDEYELGVGIEFDKLLDEKLGNLDDGLVTALAYIPPYLGEEGARSCFTS